jgi:hypothetical protein
MNTTDTTNEALILSGQGYEIEISPDALARREEIVSAAAAIVQVTDNEESSIAARHVRNLAAIRIETEKCRKAIKEPVLAVGKKIDQVAKDFLKEVDAEEARLRKCIESHATEQARIKAEKEAEERRIAEEARAAREAAEAAAAAASESGKISDVIAAKQAEAERQKLLAARMDAAEETNSARIAHGVRFAIDFEVIDARTFATVNPDLVDITPRRAETLAWLKEWAASDKDVDRVIGSQEGLTTGGIRIFKKPIVSSR